MEGISDIRIAGIDERRPPRIRREPYIDLCFRLSHKAPLDWCQDFADHLSKAGLPVKMDAKECLYIETWVRTPGRDRRAPADPQESRGGLQRALHCERSRPASATGTAQLMIWPRKPARRGN